MLNSNPVFGNIKDIDKVKFQAIMDSPLTIKERIALLKYAAKNNQTAANKDLKQNSLSAKPLRTPFTNRLSKIPSSRSTTRSIQDISSPNSTMLDSFCTSTSKVSPNNSIEKFSPMNSSELYPLQPKLKVKLGSFSSPTYHLSSNHSYKHDLPRNDNKLRFSGIPIRKTNSDSKSSKLNEDKENNMNYNGNSVESLANQNESGDNIIADSNVKFKIHRIPSIKDLDPKMLVDEKSLVDWINNTLQLNISHIEDTANGAIACQLLDIIYPLVVPMHKVNWLALEAFEAAANYKILLVCFKKLKIEHHEFIHDLISGIHSDNVNFMQWFKILFELRSPDTSNYDCYGQRCKGLGGLLTWVAPKVDRILNDCSALNITYNSVLDSIDYDKHSYIQERHNDSYYEEENKVIDTNNSTDIIDNVGSKQVEISPIKRLSEAILLESSMQSVNNTQHLMNNPEEDEDNEEDLLPFTPNTSVLHYISDSNTSNNNTDCIKSNDRIEFDTSIHLQTIYGNIEDNVIFHKYENAMLVQLLNSECYASSHPINKTIPSNVIEILPNNEDQNVEHVKSDIIDNEEYVTVDSMLPSKASVASISKTNSNIEDSRNSDEVNFDAIENVPTNKATNISIGKYIWLLLAVIAVLIIKFNKLPYYKYSKHISDSIRILNDSNTTNLELRYEKDDEDIIISQDDLLPNLEEFETMEDKEINEIFDDANEVNIKISDNDMETFILTYSYVELHQNLSITNYLQFENDSNISIITNALIETAEEIKENEMQIMEDEEIQMNNEILVSISNNQIQLENIATNDEAIIHSTFISSIEESMQWLKMQLLLVVIANVFGLIMIVYSIRMLCCITTSNHKITNLILQSPNTNTDLNNNSNTEEDSITSITKRLTSSRAKTPSRKVTITNNPTTNTNTITKNTTATTTTTTPYRTRSTFKVVNDSLDMIDLSLGYMNTRSKQTTNPNYNNGLQTNNNNNTHVSNNTSRTLWGASSPSRK